MFFMEKSCLIYVIIVSSNVQMKLFHIPYVLEWHHRLLKCIDIVG